MFPIKLDMFPGYHADRAGRVFTLEGARWVPVVQFGGKYKLQSPAPTRALRLIDADDALELSGQAVPSVLDGYIAVMAMLCGEIDPHRIVDEVHAAAIDAWEAGDPDVELHEHMGMTEAECDKWKLDPTRPMTKGELVTLAASYKARLHSDQLKAALVASTRYTAPDARPDDGEDGEARDPAPELPDARPEERQDAQP